MTRVPPELSPVTLSRVMTADPSKSSGLVVARGQRVDFPIDAAGKLRINVFQPLARAEDRSVASWQVTLAPIFQAGVGTIPQGMPARRTTPGKSGTLVVRLTFGGGGVSFQDVFSYPVNGASFAVSGDNVMVEVAALDNATAYTAATKPAVVGWIAPLAIPTEFAPLVSWAPVVSAAATPLQPWTRAVHVAADNAAATVAVVFASQTLGTLLTVNLPAAFGARRIETPLAADNVTATFSANAGAFGFERAYT